MNSLRRLSCLLLVLTFALWGSAAAQDTSILDRLREMEQAQYPDFVGATPAPTPIVIDLETTAPLVVDTAATTATLAGLVQPEVLAADLQSSATWTQTRLRIDPAMEELRLLMLGGAQPEEVQAQVEKIEADLDLILKMAPFQAPNQEPALVSLRRRIGRQLEILSEDFAEGDLRRLPTTDGLLRRSISDWADVLVEADAEGGLLAVDARDLPPEWASTDYRLPSFAPRLAAWSTDRLVDEYAARQQTIRVRLRQKPEAWDLNAAMEMGEIARELATRTREVPVASRKPFQNSALRLDVLSEGLFEFMRAGNYLHARRHLRVTERALADCRRYLTLREQGL